MLERCPQILVDEQQEDLLHEVGLEETDDAYCGWLAKDFLVALKDRRGKLCARSAYMAIESRRVYTYAWDIGDVMRLICAGLEAEILGEAPEVRVDRPH